MATNQYTCKMCGQSFSSQDELNRHNQSKHADQMTRASGQGGMGGSMGGSPSSGANR